MRVKLIDIARKLGVTTATVSLALSGKGSLSEETRARILETAKAMNYYSNQNARNLKLQKSKCLGLIVTDIKNPFFASLVDEFNRAAEEKGYSVLLGISDDKPAKEQQCLEMLISKGVDGIALVPCADGRSDHLAHLAILRQLPMPLVFCTTAYPDLAETCVMTDLAAGEYQLVKYLLTKGYRRIFFLSAARELLLSQQRLEGYRQAFQEFGLLPDAQWIIEAGPYYESGYQLADRIGNQKPDAVVTVNDFVAIGLIKAFREQGIRIPQDIAVAGYDDLLFSSLIETPITTVRQPIADLCRQTVAVLLAKIDQQNPAEQMILLPPEVIIRQSTG